MSFRDFVAASEARKARVHVEVHLRLTLAQAEALLDAAIEGESENDVRRASSSGPERIKAARRAPILARAIQALGAAFPERRQAAATAKAAATTAPTCKHPLWEQVGYGPKHGPHFQNAVCKGCGMRGSYTSGWAECPASIKWDDGSTSWDDA